MYRSVGCEKAFQVKACVRLPAGSVFGYRHRSLLDFVLNSQIGNDNFLQCNVE